MEIWCLSTTLASPEEAHLLAESAVRENLAACAQIEGPFTSIYVWKDQLVNSTEQRILFKTDAARRETLQKWIRAHHPYEVPEILAWPVAEADADYAAWIAGG